ncbi:MAG: hypothetical protein Fur0024_0110 [Patescibacteria group bacterium]
MTQTQAGDFVSQEIGGRDNEIFNTIIESRRHLIGSLLKLIMDNKAKNQTQNEFVFAIEDVALVGKILSLRDAEEEKILQIIKNVCLFRGLLVEKYNRDGRLSSLRCIKRILSEEDEDLVERLSVPEKMFIVQNFLDSFISFKRQNIKDAEEEVCLKIDDDKIVELLISLVHSEYGNETKEEKQIWNFLNNYIKEKFPDYKQVRLSVNESVAGGNRRFTGISLKKSDS